jgi:acetyltransferase
MSLSVAVNQGYPCQYESRLTINNGTEIFLRPILDTDGGLLTGLFDRLSPQTVYFRFLNPLRAIPDDMLHRLTHVDYGRDFALVAIIREGGRDSIIAVGRYAYNIYEDETDLAVVVRDDLQRLGLGTALLERVIAIGRDNGISRFVSTISPQNFFIRKTLQKLSYEIKSRSCGGFTKVEIAS